MRRPGQYIEDPEYAGRVSDYLPTRGRAGYAEDFVQGISRTTGLEGINAGFCDEASFQALERVVYGPILNYADIQGAEAALQSLMFFDHTALLSPAWGRADSGGQFQIERPVLEGEYSVFEQHLPARIISDQIFIAEYLSIENGKIISSTLENSPMVGEGPPVSVEKYLNDNIKLAGALTAYPSAHFNAGLFFRSKYSEKL